MRADAQVAMFGYFDEPEPKQRCFIGIDNGITASIGIIKEDGSYHFYTAPTKNEQDYTKAKKRVTRIDGVKLMEILSIASPESMVLVERPMINPQRWIASMSAIRAWEATITILETMKLPFAPIDSKEWQKVLLPQGCQKDDLKIASLDIGKRLFPAIDTNHPDRDGMLIAEFCKRKHR